MQFFLVILLITAVDQILKYLVYTNMLVGQSIPVINGIFHITYIHNKGAAFGMLSEKIYILILITVVILIIIVIFFLKTRKMKGVFMLHLAMAIIAGGALGNLIDRVARGYVIDYLDFRVWPVFNAADIAVVLGALFMIYYIVKSPASSR